MRTADKFLMWVARRVPTRIAAHFLNLLRQEGKVADGWGYHIRPIHYYEPLPDFRAISSQRLLERRVPRAVAFDLPAQVEIVKGLGERFGDELRDLEASGAFPFDNEYFAGWDAAVYYSLIRDLRPSRVIEIGAGYSTRIAGLALGANLREGHKGALTVIEPYPQPRLTEARIEMQLIVEPVEKVDLAVFRSLGAGDILFIDSSHVVRLGGDVFFEFLEVLPSLRPGVWVHVHDIFFPFDYPAAWVLEQRLAFNEQYFLEAFLAFNDRFVPKIANHWLGNDHPDVMDALLPKRVKHGKVAQGASFWMRRE